MSLNAPCGEFRMDVFIPAPPTLSVCYSGAAEVFTPESVAVCFASGRGLTRCEGDTWWLEVDGVRLTLPGGGPLGGDTPVPLVPGGDMARLARVIVASLDGDR